MVVSKDGYITLTQTVSVHANQTTVSNMALEMIKTPAEGAVQTGSASGTVIDNRTGYGISGLTLYVRAGIANTTGEVLYTIYTTSGGAYTLSDVPAGNYTIQVVDERSHSNEDERYNSGSFNVKVLAGSTITNQGGGVNNSVNLNVGSIRVVLRWGSTPSDLDSHLLIGSTYHVYYSTKNPSGANANLDVDDTSAYGPETITITKIMDGYTYKYYIHDYSNRGYSSSTAMSNSGAYVQIYVGASSEPLYTIYIPTGRAGYVWNVFSYNTVDGFTIYNTVGTSTP